MKAVKISVAVLILLFALVISNSVFITKLADSFAEELESIDTGNIEEVRERVNQCYEKFKKAEKFISITVSHDDLTNIEESFSELIGAAEADMKVDVITAKSRLTDAFLHLGRLSGINIESII